MRQANGVGWGRAGRVLVALVLALVALAAGVRLVAPADGEAGIRRQLAFLRAELEDGAGERAQTLFPEGYFFAHVLYGLAAVDVGRIDEARWALRRLDGTAGRAPFSASLTPSYGVFYRGWTNWLRGGMLAAQSAPERDPVEVQRFQADSVDLGAAFTASTSPFLMAYPGQAWPVDSTVAIASLRLHDHVLPPRFEGTVDRWLAAARERLDPRTGLLPHRVDAATGAPLEVARGSSQSVIQRFLVDVDPAFARDQYLRFRDQFVVSLPGFGPAVREYPIGLDGPSDVDSGPLPLGISLSATVVTLGAARVQGDAPLAGSLGNSGELVGVPIDTPWDKRYALGALPIGDAFLAWAKSARPWVSPVQEPPPASVTWWWRLPLLMLLLGLAVVGWLPELRRLRGRPSP